MDDDIGSSSLTDCLLRSFHYLKRQTELHYIGWAKNNNKRNTNWCHHPLITQPIPCIHTTLTTKPTIIFRFYSIPYTPLWLVILCPKQSHSLPCQQWAASAYPLFPPASNFADSDQLGVCMYSFGWTNAAKPFAARIWGQDIKHNWVYFCRVGILWTRTNHYTIYM